MFNATLYIMWCSARNRTRRRLQRLREPRYILGAIAGAIYLFLTLFMRERAFSDDQRERRRRRSERYQAMLPAFGAAGVAFGGVALAAAAAVSWLMPFGSGLLSFSKSETAFLFPAPVSRRDLLVYRLMRSQFAVLTGALIFALAYPTGSLLPRVRGMLGTWLLLMITHVFFTGVTLARARLRAGRAHRGSYGFVWPGIVVSFAAVAAVGGSVVRDVMAAPVLTVGDAFQRITLITREPIPSLLLYPFTAVVRPVFAQTFPEFWWSLLSAVGLYGLTVLWVMWAHESFDLAADDVVEAHARGPERRRASYASRDVGVTLAPSGRADAAFVWKSALQTFRVVDRRVLLRLVLILAWMVGAAILVARVRGLSQMLGLFAIWGAAFTVFMAPQVLRIDLRQDLQYLDLLKTWPVRGADVVRGEIAWPATVVTLIAWAFGAVGLLLSATVFGRTDWDLRHAVGVSMLILAPALIFGQYAVHNGTALLLPAWMPLGASRPRGVDAMGQRLILLGATWLVLGIALLPGIVTASVLWALLYDSIGPWVLVPGAVVGTIGIAVELVFVTEALGRVFERIDLSSIERPD